MTFADTLRFVAICEAGGLLALCVHVLIRAAKYRAPQQHIYFIAASYSLLVIGYCYEIWTRLGEGIGYRSIIGLLIFTFGVYAMVVMHRSYALAARLKRHEKAVVVAANQLLKQATDREIL